MNILYTNTRLKGSVLTTVRGSVQYFTSVSADLDASAQFGRTMRMEAHFHSVPFLCSGNGTEERNCHSKCGHSLTALGLQSLFFSYQITL